MSHKRIGSQASGRESFTPTAVVPYPPHVEKSGGVGCPNGTKVQKTKTTFLGHTRVGGSGGETRRICVQMQLLLGLCGIL